MSVFAFQLAYTFYPSAHHQLQISHHELAKALILLRADQKETIAHQTKKCLLNK